MAITNSDISMIFTLEPADAVKYLENKGYKITNNWHEMLEDAHAKAFTVSKMTDIDLLKDTHKTVTQAIKEGWSSGKAERTLRDMYIKKGWLKPEGTDGDKAKEKEYKHYMARRARTIFRTNMKTAFASGRYLQQIQDVDFAPYLQYHCVVDSRTRPEHLELNGKVFRYDDPFWAKFYPPNGWGCRCWVTQLTAEEVRRKGLIPGKSKETAEKEAQKEVSENVLYNRDTIVDEENGTTVGIGVFKTKGITGRDVFVQTDAGWGYNPGAAGWNLDVNAYAKLDGMPQQLKDKFISDMAQNIHSHRAYESFVAGVIANGLRAKGVEKTVTWLKPETLAMIQSENIMPKTPIVVMQDKRIGHIVGDRKVSSQKLTEPQLKDLYNIINKPDSVYYDTSDNSLLFIRNLKGKDIIDGRDCIKVVVKIDKFKKGHIPVNYVATAGRVKSLSLNNPAYKKIE